MGRGHGVHVVYLAAGGPLAVEIRAVPGGKPLLAEPLRVRNRLVPLAQGLVGPRLAGRAFRRGLRPGWRRQGRGCRRRRVGARRTAVQDGEQHRHGGNPHQESASAFQLGAGHGEKIAPRRFFVNPARMRILFAL